MEEVVTNGTPSLERDPPGLCTLAERGVATLWSLHPPQIKGRVISPTPPSTAPPEMN